MRRKRNKSKKLGKFPPTPSSPIPLRTSPQKIHAKTKHLIARCNYVFREGVSLKERWEAFRSNRYCAALSTSITIQLPFLSWCSLNRPAARPRRCQGSPTNGRQKSDEESDEERDTRIRKVNQNGSSDRIILTDICLWHCDLEYALLMVGTKVKERHPVPSRSGSPLNH